MNLKDGISIYESLIVTVLSMGIVFTTLIVIYFILSGFKLIFYKKETNSTIDNKDSIDSSEKSTDIDEEVAVAIAVATTEYEKSNTLTSDEDLIVVITAAIVAHSEENDDLNINNINRI